MEEYRAMRIEGRRVPLELIKENFFVEFSDSQQRPQIMAGPDTLAGLQPGAYRFIATGSAGQALRDNVFEQTIKIMEILKMSPVVGAQPIPLPPENARLIGELEQLLIVQSECSNKDRIMMNHRAAMEMAVQRNTMMMQAPAQPALPPGEPPQPEQPPMPEQAAYEGMPEEGMLQ
jgi:hypothetical protein